MMVYLDNAATTRIDPEVLDEMMPFLTEEFGNAGTIYDVGLSAKSAIRLARERVAEFLGAEDVSQIIFTSGATESNNMVISRCNISDHSRIVTSPIEHDSIIKPAFHSNKAYNMCRCDSSGVVDVERMFDDDTYGFVRPGLAAIMYVNNEVGCVQDVMAIGEMCRKKDVLFLTDCVQAAGYHKIDVGKIGCDFASISSHKIHGPKGVGALYIKDRKTIKPLIYGGADQEFGLRGGTENVAGIVGFGKACELAGKSISSGEVKRINDLKNAFWDALKSRFEKTYGISGVLTPNAESDSTDGKILSFKFEAVDAETMILMLNSKGICVSAGSACRSHEQEASRVLKAIGLTDDEARNSIRVSFSRMNTSREVLYVASVIADTAFQLREYAGNV